MVGFKGSDFKAQVRQPEGEPRHKKKKGGGGFKLFKPTYRFTGRFTYSETLYGEPLKCCLATEHNIKSSPGSDKWFGTLNSWTSRPLPSQDRKQDTKIYSHQWYKHNQSYRKLLSISILANIFPNSRSKSSWPKKGILLALHRRLVYWGIFVSWGIKSMWQEHIVNRRANIKD